MTQHTLESRTEKEIFWFQRRGFLQAAAAWSAMGGFAAAQAQQRSNIVELEGDALLNGQKLNAQQTIQTGDNLETGPDSGLVFVLGNSSLRMRQNSRLTIERGTTLNTVSILRMFTGAVASVWSRGASRQIITPTLTAGIRGTGVYTEVFAQQNDRSYFCNCYGTINLQAGPDMTVSQASYHQAFWAEVEPKNGRYLTAAKAINHTDEELEYLAQLVNQRTAWQIAGKKGVKDGMGYMEDHPASDQPAAKIPVQ